MAEVKVTHLNKRYANTMALDDVTIGFAEGEFYGLLGPSGSGKTTLLRTIAGFVFADSGSVTIAGKPVERVPVEKREIGMVFQNYALFPNMSVADNIGFGLRVRKLTSSQIKRKVGEVLDLVQLGDLGTRRPHQLSGGQRQRVALARAIVTEPRVLLLDEPLSALDKALRMDMQVELKRIQREIGITTIFVTHDQEEALTLSDRIGILKDGALVQQGAPREVYDAPVNEFAARFLGDANLFDGKIAEGGIKLEDGTVIQLPRTGNETSDKIRFAIRPENLVLSTQPRESWNNIEVEVQQTIFSGPIATHLLTWRGHRISVMTKGGERLAAPGQSVVLSWRPESAIILAPAET